MPKLLLVALCLLFLAGCTNLSSSPSVANATDRKQAFSSATMASLVPEQTQIDEPIANLNYHAMLATAQEYARAQQYVQATKVIKQIVYEKLSQIEQIQLQLLNAQIALATDKPVIAQQILQSMPDMANLPISVQIVHDDLLANTYATLGQILQAIKIRLELSLLLNEAKAEKANKQAVWRLAQQLSTENLTMLSQDTSQPVLSGWAALTLLAKREQDLPQRLTNDIRNWRLQYLGHPANTLLAEVLPDTNDSAPAAAKKVAVLLPLQGLLAAQGQAVWQGFLYAYYQMPTSQRPILLIYDLGQISAPKAYQYAIDENVDFIIGPLSKEDVDKIARNRSKTPVLALNYSNNIASANFYELGLSLKNDVEQIAQRIWQDNCGHVITVTMDNQAGNTLLDDFTKQFVERGGQIVENIKINAKTDLKTVIAAALQSKQSVTSNNQKDLVCRQDIDAIFLNLPPDQARAVMPLLQYYYIGYIPVYATSLVYSGIPAISQNYDLNKIMFTEMPWVLRTSETFQTGRQLLSQLYPENYKNYSKLYAIGMDAYHLIFELNRLRIFPESTYKGVTGTLSIGENHQLYRQLSWGKFVKGRAVPYTKK